ncbi:MAG TPA: hypothetical protein VL199_16230 [Burkholderiales bacterium]|jgi:hypothetical protein|nr:hypothetical protein [Burkholderiales bacterium]
MNRLFLLAIVCASLSPSTSSAAEPRAISTFESIGVYWTPPSDPGPAGCPIQFRKSGDPSWREGLPLWFDARNHECRGSLVQLEPGTKYEMKVGGTQFHASTWSEKFPIARTVKVSSNQPLTISDGGSASGYIVYDGGGATIDSGDSNITIAAPYVIVRGFTLKGAKQDAIKLMPGAHDVVIEDNDISGWGRFRYTNSKGWQIGMDMDAGVRAVCSKDWRMERTIVQRNRIHHPRYGANSWSWGHPAGPQALTYSHCGGNHVIRYNEIYSDDGHYFNDGIGGEDNFSDIGFPNADSDIYGNKISHAWDDGIESEGGNRNVRIWGNYLDLTATGVASTVTHNGPLYVFRNVYARSRKMSERAPEADDRGPFAKAGRTDEWGGGRRYFFHNTSLGGPQGAGQGISGNSGQPLTNSVSRNNLWLIWKSGWEAINEAGGSGNDFDYDLYNGKLSTYRGAEKHGIESEKASAGVDHGVRIPNFNDNYVGAAPDIGAQENGAVALRFGLDAGESRDAATLRTARKQ